MTLRARVEKEWQTLDRLASTGGWPAPWQLRQWQALLHELLPNDDVLAALRHEFDEWEKSTEYMRTTTRPMDAGEQMAQRDAYDLLRKLLALFP